MPKRVLAAGITVCLGAVAPGPQAGRELASAEAVAAHAASAAGATSWQVQKIVSLRKRSLYMQRVMHIRSTTLRPAAKRRLETAATPRRRAQVLITLWRGVYRRTRAAYRSPPFLAELSCIQRGEGAWHEASNPFYDGGLQMDQAFQARYGAFLLRRKGRAYNWTPLEQIWTAVYAIRGPDHRGFFPWPLTARACHLM